MSSRNSFARDKRIDSSTCVDRRYCSKQTANPLPRTRRWAHPSFLLSPNSSRRSSCNPVFTSLGLYSDQRANLSPHPPPLPLPLHYISDTSTVTQKNRHVAILNPHYLDSSWTAMPWSDRQHLLSPMLHPRHERLTNTPPPSHPHRPFRYHMNFKKKMKIRGQNRTAETSEKQPRWCSSRQGERFEYQGKDLTSLASGRRTAMSNEYNRHFGLDDWLW
ncbi:hypothetical protein RRG08_065988 [Elysia crispata]|uniref:Uncharacterized protein n=1 Tax=Elysia crispata TaxID=231223 RepID=A0AAE1A6T6_9GAST|nr:hypothetical protein RRG08_065988 [Elysia crispata]